MKKNIDQIVEEALRAEPIVQLSSDFKYKTLKAIRKVESRAQKRLYFLIGFGSFLMVLMGLTTIAVFIPELLDVSKFTSGQGVDSLVPIAILIGIMLVIIQFLDKRLIKDRYLSH